MTKLEAAREAIEAVCREHNVKIIGPGVKDWYGTEPLFIVSKGEKGFNDLTGFKDAKSLKVEAINHETR